MGGLENALANCPCGLLLVSHDERLLTRLAGTLWQIAEDPSARGDMTLTIRDME